jgi:hypothetical protein
MQKEEIIDLYRAVKKDIQKPPTFREFFKQTGIKKQIVVKKFRLYSELVKEAGDSPRTFINIKYSEEDYMKSFGDFIREHKRLPSINDWIFYCKKPSVNAYITKYDCKWSEVLKTFFIYAKDVEEWKDVIEIINEQRLGTGLYLFTEEKVTDKSTNAGSLSYIPQVLQDLSKLSFTDSSGYEFEEKCKLAMSMLGYEVTALGQGKGRNPDGIAKDIKNRYAIIYDTKARQKPYMMGSDDRAIIEYIKNQKKLLISQGYEIIYFLIISSTFGNVSTYNIQSETGIITSLISAENLLLLLGNKIEKPLEVDTGCIKKLFVKGGEITREEILRIKN